MAHFKVDMVATARATEYVEALWPSDAMREAQRRDPRPDEVGDWDVDSVEEVDAAETRPARGEQPWKAVARELYAIITQTTSEADGDRAERAADRVLEEAGLELGPEPGTATPP